ncbi:MAG: YraN family protein [Gammaproteobacteria bacterium]|nr:YraN family protein [Gammaproteobacteria bacterium]
MIRLSIADGDSDARALGHRAEEAACRFLLDRGLSLLERNYRHRRGEIDLIMQEKTCIVFVEVRCRSSARYGSALESVDRRKQEKLIAAAQHYLQTHARAAKYSARFDVISVTPDARATDIAWVKDAFGA